jgi:hydroxymethylpyrimidine pyrophosphatase-like HAD family hydrolase
MVDQQMCNLEASLALACDYDGTLACQGAVSETALQALLRFRNSGRKLFLATGRVLLDLQNVFSRLDLFDAVIAENGPILFYPSRGDKRILAQPIPQRLISKLRKAGVTEIAAGEIIVAVPRIYESRANQVIADLDFSLQRIYNKDSLMFLPQGMDKMAGLAVALEELHIPPERVIAIGDGENDVPLLEGCGCAVAVANAVPELKRNAQIVTTRECSDGVIELISRVLFKSQTPDSVRG